MKIINKANSGKICLATLLVGGIIHFTGNKMNKRGAEKIISIYWFAILIIIAGAVVAMVSLFYGAPYDVRDTEANILGNKVTDCLSSSGKLNKNLFLNGGFNENFNLKKECNLIFETEFKSEREEYFLQAELYDLDNEKVFSFLEGNYNLYSDCKIKDKKFKKLSKCAEREFYSLSHFSDDVFKIKIISVVRKTEKNVK